MNKEWKQLLDAARSGNAEAQFEVGIYYRDGFNDSKGNIVVRKNPQKAVIWFQHAAELGNASAQNELGICMSDGFGVPKNDRKAIYWTRKAIRGGDLSAASNLAMIL